MFSRAKFNATKLNVSASVNEVLFRAVFSEVLSARMGVGVELHLDSLSFSALLAQTALGASAIPHALSLSEELTAAADAFLAAPIETLFAGALEASSVHIRANHFHTKQMGSGLALRSSAGASVWLASHFGDGLSGEAKLGAKIASGSVFSEIVTVSPDASSQSEQVVLIKVSIPAGSELRIDSERYTVTLDGENILHLQEGDWIMLDRDLCEITVDSGTGAELIGKMVWTERYL